MQTTADNAQAGLLTRVLGPKQGEYTAIVWSFTYFFCVLASYYMIRPVRESMAVGSGPNTVPLLFTGTFIAMLVAAPIFGWVASRFPRRAFLPWVYLFFISNILLFWWVFSTAISNGTQYVWLGRIFFVWISVFNLFVVSVFWSFMADIWNREQGRRLFGLISAGGSLGAFLGGRFTTVFVEDLGFQNLFPVSAGLLFIAVIAIRRLGHWVETTHSGGTDRGDRGRLEALGGSAFSGFSHVAGIPYFRAIAAGSVIASLLGTALYMFSIELVAAEIEGTNSQTAFFSLINDIQNFVTILGQAFVVKHVVKRFGIGVSLSLLPILSVAGFILLAFFPVLAVVAGLTAIRRAVGFIFSKPTTDMLYSVVSPEDKYKVKNFIDTAIYRGGDVAGTWAIRGMMGAFGAGVAGISLLMVPFAIAWAGLAIWLGRDYRRRAAAQTASIS